MAKKPNLTLREKKSMETVKNATNEKVIEAVMELSQLQEEASQLMDALYFTSLKKTSVSSYDLTVLVEAYAKQVEITNKAIADATKSKGKKIAKTVRVERV